MKKASAAFSFAASALLLAGCSMSVEQVEETRSELETQLENGVSTNNELHNLEVQMDEQFATVLAEDESLSSLADGSAQVNQNITQREEIIAESENQIASINEQVESLENYDGDELSNELLTEVSNDFTEYSQALQDYTELYQNSLNTQNTYLSDIAAEDANYEDFSHGIESVNENYAEVQQARTELDNHLSNTQDSLNQLRAAIEEANPEAVQAAEDDAENNEDTDGSNERTYLKVNNDPLLTIPDEFPQKFTYDDGVEIEYPEDGVKGIYVTSHSAGGERMEELVDLLNSTDLNSMVIDVKDDYGNITLDLNSDNELVNEMTNSVIDGQELMTLLEENDIYPIARIVVFKDSRLAEAHPEWSFRRQDGSVWENNRGEAFVNPYLKEVWDYNLEVAKQAAKLGFKDIQFDYVRFPEGFENVDRELSYSFGHYGDDSQELINMEARNQAVTDFVSYAREQLQPYGVDVSVDIFGYAAVVRETPGIGQSFPGIASNVDVISSMIYPSHWGVGNLGVDIPDLEPYNVVNNYMEVEQEIFDELGEDAPISRPWIQDFTASYLGAGYYQPYGAEEVTAQVKALADNGVHEFLLWDAANTYSEGATYSFE